MILQTTFSAPSLLFSSCSPHRLRFHPLLFSKRRRRAVMPSLFTTPRCVSVAAATASDNGVFTSPETAKSFDFTNEERIYTWWESRGYFRPSFDRGSDPFVISMPPPNVTGSLHMGHAMFVTLEIRWKLFNEAHFIWVRVIPKTCCKLLSMQFKGLERGRKQNSLGKDVCYWQLYGWNEIERFSRTIKGWC